MLRPAVPVTPRFVTQNNTVFVYVLLGVVLGDARFPISSNQLVLVKIAVATEFAVPIWKLSASWSFDLKDQNWRLPSHAVFMQQQDDADSNVFVDVFVEDGNENNAGLIRFDTSVPPDAPFTEFDYPNPSNKCSVVDVQSGCFCTLYFFANVFETYCGKPLC
jgi:hypothetical protein